MRSHQVVWFNVKVRHLQCVQLCELPANGCGVSPPGVFRPFSAYQLPRVLPHHLQHIFGRSAFSREAYHVSIPTSMNTIHNNLESKDQILALRLVGHHGCLTMWAAHKIPRVRTQLLERDGLQGSRCRIIA